MKTAKEWAVQILSTMDAAAREAVSLNCALPLGAAHCEYMEQMIAKVQTDAIHGASPKEWAVHLLSLMDSASPKTTAAVDHLAHVGIPRGDIAQMAWTASVQLEAILAACMDGGVKPETVDGRVSHVVTVAQLVAKVRDLTDKLSQAQTQLAGVLVVAEGGPTEDCAPGDFGWSLAFEKVKELRRRYEPSDNAAKFAAMVNAMPVEFDRGLAPDYPTFKKQAEKVDKAIATMDAMRYHVERGAAISSARFIELMGEFISMLK